MKIKTHYLIGKIAVNKELPLTPLQKLMFCIGTVLPDLSPSQFIHTHFYKNSSEYIFKKLEKLLYLSSPFVMIEYGKIAHYCSDFCCSVHFSGSIGNIYEHITYEKRLNKFAQENYNKLCRDFNELETENIELRNIFDEYSQCKKFDLYTDMIYAIRATSAVRNYMLVSMLQEKLI